MSRHHVRLSPKQWRLARMKVLHRDKFRCKQCGRAGRLEVDHVIPLDKGGDPWDLANLQALCRDCHIKKTRRENRRTPTPAEKRWQKLVRELVSGRY